MTTTIGSVRPAPGARLWGLVRLLRPLNFVLFLGGVALGGFLSAGVEAFEGVRLFRLCVAAASAALVGGAANSLNDVYDLEIDRVNRPERPLPAGLVSPAAARLVWGAASLLGVVLSLLLTPAHAGLALGSVLLLAAYSARLKRTVFWGNAVVALVVALALVFGGLAVGPAGPALVGAAFAFLTTLAREIVKDVQDVAGDAAGEARTLAVAYGPRAGARAAAVVLGLTVLLTPLPFLLLGYSGLYLLLVLAIDALLLATLRQLGRAPEAERAGRASALLKGAMVLGMIALALASAPE